MNIFLFFVKNTKDPFGDDPFANLHAPTRPESPSPALPPKKAKQPPPRPAPPRPNQGPTGPLRAAPAPPTPSPTPDPFANSDPFGTQQTIDNNNFTSSGGFADFTNFDSKVYPPLFTFLYYSVVFSLSSLFSSDCYFFQ